MQFVCDNNATTNLVWEEFIKKYLSHSLKFFLKRETGMKTGLYLKAVLFLIFKSYKRAFLVSFSRERKFEKMRDFFKTKSQPYKFTIIYQIVNNYLQNCKYTNSLVNATLLRSIGKLKHTIGKGTFYSEDVGEIVTLPFIWTFFCTWAFISCKWHE